MTTPLLKSSKSLSNSGFLFLHVDRPLISSSVLNSWTLKVSIGLIPVRLQTNIN